MLITWSTWGLSRLSDVDSDVVAGIGDDGVLVYSHPDDISGFTSLLLFFFFHSFLFCIQNFVQPFSRLPVLFNLFLLLENLFYGGALAHLRSVSCRLDSVRCGGVLD